MTGIKEGFIKSAFAKMGKSMIKGILSNEGIPVNAGDLLDIQVLVKADGSFDFLGMKVNGKELKNEV